MCYSAGEGYFGGDAGGGGGEDLDDDDGDDAAAAAAHDDDDKHDDNDGKDHFHFQSSSLEVQSSLDDARKHHQQQQRLYHTHFFQLRAVSVQHCQYRRQRSRDLEDRHTNQPAPFLCSPLLYFRHSSASPLLVPRAKRSCIRPPSTPSPPALPPPQIPHDPAPAALRSSPCILLSAAPRPPAHRRRRHRRCGARVTASPSPTHPFQAQSPVPTSLVTCCPYLVTPGLSQESCPSCTLLPPTATTSSISPAAPCFWLTVPAVTCSR